VRGSLVQLLWSGVQQVRVGLHSLALSQLSRETPGNCPPLAFDTEDSTRYRQALSGRRVDRAFYERGGSAIYGRTTRHDGYQVSQRKRKRIEEVFGWVKTVGRLRKTRHGGLEAVAWVFTFASQHSPTWAPPRNELQPQKWEEGGIQSGPIFQHPADPDCYSNPIRTPQKVIGTATATTTD
jgi:hypothetical protein